MKPAPRILIVDDDPHIRDVVRYALRKDGFETEEAGDGAAALEAFRRSRPDLLILDILMPEMDGTEVCRAVRTGSSVPIIFLSSRDEEIDRIVGLELGGDDYITKPFSPRELVARVRAVLRRARSLAIGDASAGDHERAVHGRLALDPDRFRVWWDADPVVLTVTEFGLLRVLLRHPGRVYTRHELMQDAYPDATVVSDRTIDSHIRRIRRKFSELGADPIETIHGLGYKLGPCA